MVANLLVNPDLAPNSVEAEEAVLGSIMINPESIAVVSGFLTPDDFFLVKHGWIFEAMLALDDRGDDIDNITVVEELITKGKLEEVGGSAAITKLINGTPTHLHAETYARIVEHMSVRRKGLKACGDMAQLFIEANRPLPELIQQAHDILTDATKIRQDGDFKFISEFASENYDKVQTAYNNNGVPAGISTGLVDLDKELVAHGWNDGEVILIAARPGMGKCLAKGTEVMLYNGDLIKVEDVKTSNLLMGPDSSPRSVLSLAHGVEPLYWVHQQKGISYKVNGPHILSLKRSKNEGKHSHGDILNISVDEILGNTGMKPRGPGFFARYKGYKVAVDFPESNVPIPAYFLGLWLGDGTTASSSIHNADPEIGEYLAQLALDRGEVLTVYNNRGRHCNTYRIKATMKNRYQSLQVQLRELGILGNKHIPKSYLANSRDIRLSLLAGLIDSDGCYQAEYNTYEITLALPDLAKQIKFLADTLGYRTSLIEKPVTCQTGFSGMAYRVRFSGDMTDIPVLIERKKPRNPVYQKDSHVTGIRIESAGEGEYFGFELDGDGLFLLADMTVTHNTALAMGSAVAAASQGKHTLIVTKEMTGNELTFRVTASGSGLTGEQMKQGNLTGPEWTRFTDATGIASELPIAIDDTPNTDVKTLVHRIKRLHREWGIDLLVIDFVQLLESNVGRAIQNRNNEIDVIGRALKELAQTFRIPVIALSQLNRDLEKRADKRPIMSDLRDSGTLEQVADTIIFIYRDDFYDENSNVPGIAELHIAKQRNHKSGARVTTRCVGNTTSFIDYVSNNINLEGF